MSPASFPAAPCGSGDAAGVVRSKSDGEILYQRKLAVRVGHHCPVRPLLPQRLQDQSARPIADTICKTSSRRPICAVRPTAASSISAAIASRAEPPTPISASIRSPPVLDYNSTFAFRPDRAAASAARQGRAERGQHRARRGAYQSVGAQHVRQSFIVDSAHRRDVIGVTARRRDQSLAILHAIACCAASLAIMRASPSKSPGSASSSTRSARPGRRSCSPGSTASRPRSTPAGIFSYALELGSYQFGRSPPISAPSSGSAGTAMPGVGLEYRYPLFRPPPSGNRFSSRSRN